MEKLRVRAAGGGATIRIQVPPGATLYDLRNAISEAVHVPADSIRLSLNKRDEIGGDPSVHLRDLGIRPGDLLFYFDADVVSDRPTAAPSRTEPPISGRLDEPMSEPMSEGDSRPPMSAVVMTEADRRRELCAAAADRRAHEAEKKGAGPSQGEDLHEAEKKGAGPSQGEDLHEAENEGVPKAGPSSPTQDDDLHRFDTKHQIPHLLSRILYQEHESIKSPQDLLAVAVHAVMLETGFVVVGSPEERLSWASISYTLPQLLHKPDALVVIRFQSLGKFLIVYGSVSGSGQAYRLSLSVSKFLRNVSGSSVQMSDGLESESVYKDAFELWKEIKDGLAVPILMLLCEKLGLTVPACFQILPMELKMKILGLVSAVDLAALARVSSELRFLASNEELWKQKYIKEFKWKEGDAVPAGGWIVAYIREWYSRKGMQRRHVSRRDAVIPHHRSRWPPSRYPSRYPNYPFIIGGNHDIYPGYHPGFGDPPRGMHPFGGLHRYDRSLTRGSSRSGLDIDNGFDAPPELHRPGDDGFGAPPGLPRPGDDGFGAPPGLHRPGDDGFDALPALHGPRIYTEHPDFPRL